jgi:predicted acylesterase/phospholipase RssA
MPTAFVLAGGGSLGAVEAGMLRAVIEHGDKADFVVGASTHDPMVRSRSVSAVR